MNLNTTRIMQLGLIALSSLAMLETNASNIDPSNKYAWSENSGWINFAPSHGGGATVYDDHLEGFVWAENIGWIKLGSTGGGTSYYDNTTSTDWGVNNDGAGNLSGYAWSENMGWINFNPTHSQVTIDSSGDFDGYAWSENVGWIHFQNASPAYKVSLLDSENDVTPPTCSLSASGGVLTVIVQDEQSGLYSIEVISENNTNFDTGDLVTGFTEGQTEPFSFTVSKEDPNQSASIEFGVTDDASNYTSCDPIITLVIRENGKPVSETHTGLPQVESNVTVTNGDPGLKNLEIIVNGDKYKVTGLKDNDELTIDLSDSMVEGNNNIMTLTAKGKPGTEATVMISD